MELLPCSGFKSNICAHPKGFVQKVMATATATATAAVVCCGYGPMSEVSLQVHKQWGTKEPPFIFCIAFFVPCSPDNYMFNIYGALDPAIDKKSKPYQVLKRFMDGTKEEQDKKFKLIPRVAEGGWFVRKACGDPPTPAIMGNKVNQVHALLTPIANAQTVAQICTKGKGYFEVDFNLGESAVAGGILKVVLGPCK